MPNASADRLKRLFAVLERKRIDALVVSHLPNVRYLSAFTGSNALLLVTPGRATLFTDPRYTLQAGRECEMAVKIARGSLWPEAMKTARRGKARRIALEAARASHAAWLEVESLLGPRMRIERLDGEVEKLRAVKSRVEIERIRRSVSLNSKAYERALARIRPTMTEKDLAAIIDHEMRKMGAEGPAFETIVAAGERSALPHARPAARPLGRNRILLVDMGARLEGYASDMTRVVHLGRPGKRACALHAAVLEAQLAALEKVKAGARAADVDGAARRTLKKYGLDRAFHHGTGHGLGLEIHESPRLGRTSEEVLEAGMVITIEPGAYVEGYGGVRIEDTVVVTKTGAEILTPTTKQLVVLET